MRRVFSDMQGAEGARSGMYLGTWAPQRLRATKQSRKKTSIWGISSAGRAPALHAGGQGFEPLILHHEPQEVARKMYLENWIKYQIVYKQVNNENEIEINHKSVFSKFCGFWNSWGMESKDTISMLNRETRKFSLRVKQ